MILYMHFFRYAAWAKNFEVDAVPEALTAAEKVDFLASFDGVTLSSDAFFPFRDSIDHASKFGVSYVSIIFFNFPKYFFYVPK